MRNSWYFRCAGVESGPVLFEKLIELARSGRIGPTDELRRSDEQSWHAASDVEGLFGDAASSQGTVDSLFDDILEVAAADDGSHASGQRVGTLLEDQLGFDPHHAAISGKVARYYCRMEGKEAGPFTLPELQQHADDGLITPFDRVRGEDAKAWVPAQEITEIHFSPKPPTSAQAHSITAKSEARTNERSRPAAEPHNSSIESVIDDVLNGDSDNSTSVPTPTHVPSASPKPAPVLPPLRTETRADDNQSRHSAILAAAMAAASAAPIQKPEKKQKKQKEKRVSRSGSRFEMPGMTWIMALVGVLLLAAAMKWMGREGTPPVSGEAKVDGQPIPIGTISFLPIAGTKGEPLATPVIDGEFAAGPDERLGDGKHRVRVVIGNPMGGPPPELAAVPAFAALNGAVFEKEIDTTSDAEGVFIFEFAAADAKMQSESTGSAFSLEQ
jgi:hypothetical protein